MRPIVLGALLVMLGWSTAASARARGPAGARGNRTGRADSGRVIRATEESFPRLVAHGTTLVDFSATWCASCRALAPVLERLAGDLGGRARVVSVDVDAHPRLVDRLGVEGLPTLILFKNGKPAARILGARSQDELRAFVDRLTE